MALSGRYSGKAIARNRFRRMKAGANPGCLAAHCAGHALTQKAERAGFQVNIDPAIWRAGRESDPIDRCWGRKTELRQSCVHDFPLVAKGKEETRGNASGSFHRPERGFDRVRISLDKQFDPAAFKAEAGQNCFGKSNLIGQPRDLILLARMGEGSSTRRRRRLLRGNQARSGLPASPRKGSHVQAGHARTWLICR